MSLLSWMYPPSHYPLWEVKDRAFLPLSDPITKLDFSEASTIENLAANLPKHVADHSIRKELVDGLRQIKNIDACLDEISSPHQAERAMMLYSYFASSYIHAPGEPVVNLLPKEIAKPFVRLAKEVKRPPILSYASYCLYNWQRIDTSKPVELGNIKLLQNFTLSDGRRDENWFILVHVDIEAKAAKLVSSVDKFINFKVKEEEIPQIFKDVYESATGIYQTLCRMEEECSTDVYFDKVRPYIFSYENIIYEDVGPEPLNYRGETGAQSSVIPTLQTVLGVRHKDSMLTAHLKDMRNYMPETHRSWLEKLETFPSLRDFVSREFKDDYNKCVGRLVDFRKKHLEYSINYIQKKVANPKGTGGTPYIKWLSELINETEAFYL